MKNIDNGAIAKDKKIVNDGEMTKVVLKLVNKVRNLHLLN